MARLGGVLQPGRRDLIRVEPTYLYAECRTKTMRFVDDFRSAHRPVAHVIHVRSASRLRRSDLGVNRARVVVRLVSLQQKRVSRLKACAIAHTYGYAFAV